MAKAAKKLFLFIECDLFVTKLTNNPLDLLELLVKMPDRNKIINQIIECELFSLIDKIRKGYNVVI